MFGYTLILNLYDCNRELIDAEDAINAWMLNFLECIGMEAEEWILRRYTGRDIETEGYTLCCMLTTSSLSVHFVPHTGNIYIDLTTCKPFDLNKAVEFCEKWFEPDLKNYHFSLRV